MTINEYPFYSATVVRNGDVIVSKECDIIVSNEDEKQFLISPETLYVLIEEMLASENMRISRRDGHVSTVVSK